MDRKMRLFAGSMLMAIAFGAAAFTQGASPSFAASEPTRAPSRADLQRALDRTTRMQVMVERILLRGGGGHEPRLEADLPAVAAATRIQQSLSAQADAITGAIADFGTPTGDMKIKKACTEASNIQSQAGTGKFVAGLPIVGNIKPEDFDGFITETQAQRVDLKC